MEIPSLNDVAYVPPEVVFDYDEGFDLEPDEIPEEQETEEENSGEDISGLNKEVKESTTLTDEESSPEDYEEVEWTYPDFVPDDLVVPEKFDDEAQELQWYKDNYYKAIDFYATDTMRDAIANRYKDTLMQAEQHVDGLKAVEQLFQGHPDVAIKLYAPEYLAQKGYPGQLSDEEIQGLLKDYLSKDFGEDFLEKYDEKDLENPNSISSKIYARHEQILAWARKENERIAQVSEANKPPSIEQIKEHIKQEYDTTFKDVMTQEEYQQFVPKALNKLGEITLADVYLIVNRDEFAKAAYDKGVKDGKAGIVRNIERAGSKKIVREPVHSKQPDKSEEEYNRLGGLTNSIYNQLLKG